MTRLSLQKSLFLVGMVLLISGCPGKDYLEKRREGNKADCLAFGGSWEDRGDYGGTCSPEFGKVIQGTWISECMAAESEGFSQMMLTFHEDTVQILEFAYPSEACSEKTSEVEIEANYSLYIFNGQDSPGQRTIRFNSDIPEKFQSWKQVSIEDLNKLTILPQELRFSRLNLD